MFAEKLAGQFYERFPKTLKNALNFPVELKPLFLKNFKDHANAISEQNISHVTDRTCMLRLFFIKQGDRISPESFDVTK